MNVNALSLNIESCLDNGTCLHLSNLGIGITQAAATVTQHGVEFLQTVANEFHFLEGAASLLGKLSHGLELMGYELVQGRIEQADGHFIAIHSLEDTLEVATLQGQQLAQGNAA